MSEPVTTPPVRLYDGDADPLMDSAQFADRVSLIPPGSPGGAADGSTRILWGQDMLRDLIDGRYRVVVCGVNTSDNSHGIIAQLVDMIPTSQWSAAGVTSYARLFMESAAVMAPNDSQPYVLKYDLDSLLILGLLRPDGQDHFTLSDLSHGFATVAKMLAGRRDRQPVATVSFLGARSNRLEDGAGNEPSLETVLRTMHEAGFRGDLYPSPSMWRCGDVGVFPRYPYPDGVARMRDGSS